MEWITNPEIWIGLLTLTVLEIVLGIDNIRKKLTAQVKLHQPYR
jgi:predicted tellurium resistance membrane protein TerC